MRARTKTIELLITVGKQREELQANKNEIEREIRTSFDSRITALKERIGELKIERSNAIQVATDDTEKLLEDCNKQLDRLRIDFAREEIEKMTYPLGTMVYRWDYLGVSWLSGSRLVKGDKTGIISVFEGTEELATTGDNPKQIGTIYVRHVKNDGSLGKTGTALFTLNIHTLSFHKSYNAGRWLSENDTAEDNIYKRLEQAKEEEE